MNRVPHSCEALHMSNAVLMDKRGTRCYSMRMNLLQSPLAERGVFFRNWIDVN